MSSIEERLYVRDGRGRYVRPQGEREKFLFYRGVGSLELPLEIRSSGDDDNMFLALRNRGPEDLKGIFVVRVEKDRVRAAVRDDLPAGASRVETKAVLQFWIDIDLENLDRLRSGVLNFQVPHPYSTGECKVRGWAVQGVNRAEREAVDQGIALLRKSLDWVSDQLYKHGDLPGAIRGLLLLRHLYWSDYHSPAS